MRWNWFWIGSNLFDVVLMNPWCLLRAWCMLDICIYMYMYVSFCIHIVSSQVSSDRSPHMQKFVIHDLPWWTQTALVVTCMGSTPQITWNTCLATTLRSQPGRMMMSIDFFEHSSWCTARTGTKHRLTSLRQWVPNYEWHPQEHINEWRPQGFQILFPGSVK